MSTVFVISTPLVDQFRQDLVNGVYNPRERLVEAELATRYRVNRSAMRAALLELTFEGLVEREPNRGARVRALEIEDGIEIAQVRRELESLCARLAAERGNDEEREELRQIAARIREAFEANDTSRYLIEHAAFHGLIHRMARHRVARDILTRLGNLNFNLHFPMALSAPLPSASVAEHERIADAIIRGDGNEAAAAMVAHLDALIEALQARRAATAAPGQPAPAGATAHSLMAVT
ncbi:MAG TPA: GntR family transcriptional regulator [Solirubrobacteraceae bacterium]|jgi:DNA-binding GntR family transcriptional regulator